MSTDKKTNKQTANKPLSSKRLFCHTRPSLKNVQNFGLELLPLLTIPSHMQQVQMPAFALEASTVLPIFARSCLLTGNEAFSKALSLGEGWVRLDPKSNIRNPKS
ncbi:hypothetical protein [Mucilaginibacter gynuensis]|uniref:hypothetical protein n=1 Tax=Mucilaginibacter gynuensis TaxID=1302236 RepID=UPI0031EAD791